MINEVASGVLVEVIVQTGLRAGTAMAGPHGRRHKEDLDGVSIDTERLGPWESRLCGHIFAGSLIPPSSCRV